MALWYGRAGNRARRWMYVVLMLLITAAAIVFIYGRFSFSGTEPTSPAAVNQEEGLAGKLAKSDALVAELLGGGASGFEHTTAEDNPQVAELISEAMSYIDANPARVIDARDRLNEALPLPMSRQQRQVCKQRLSELADKWLFSRTIFPQDRLTGSYKVAPGEQLSTIAKEFKVPFEILLELNKIGRPEALRAEEVIKVINGPFHARVYRSAFVMDLYLQNTFVRSFPVGLGKGGMETPTGLWSVKVGGKMIAPRWTDPISGRTYEAEDPDYPLGSRWIGLEGIGGDAVGRTGFAIHGTKDPNGIGVASSQGCIRLHNGDAVLVYNLLEPGQSRVEVVE